MNARDRFEQWYSAGDNVVLQYVRHLRDGDGYAGHAALTREWAVWQAAQQFEGRTLRATV